MQARRTQKNEVGRCAVLLPALPPGSLALFEVGASAGLCLLFYFFFFNDTATTEIYTLSLHDALPIRPERAPARDGTCSRARRCDRADRKSTRLNSSHVAISYAVFCLKNKKTPPI